MPVDRGGLRYPIVVENNFTGPINDFKAQIKSAGSAFSNFKNRVSGSTAGTKDAAKGLNQLNQSLRRTVGSTDAATLATERANKANAASIAINAALIQQKKLAQLNANASNAVIGGLRKEQAAVNTLAAAYRRLAAAKKAAGIQVRANQFPSAARAPRQFAPQTASPSRPSRASAAAIPVVPKGSIKDLFNFQSLLGRTQSIADRASFSLQRLFTVIFAFAVVRTISDAFVGLVGKMVTFNATVEKSVLAIASLVLASGQVRDATGETVDSATGLALAQKEARKQTNLLRADAIKTAATFEELLSAFQTAIGPGLQAGLSLGDIRKFTVQISQAAAAIGLPQNQLTEEIRSLLSGTINVRNTRIAAALGITNEDIRRAKEQGQLLQFLQKRFAAFTTAGEESLNTFEVLFQQVNEAIALTVGAGGLEFFVALKDTLREIFDVATTADPISGVITPNPQAVGLVREIGKALIDALDEARKLGQALGFGSFGAVAKTISDAIRVASKVLSGFIEGFVKGIGNIQTIFTLIGVQIEKIFGRKLFDETNLQKTVAVVTQFLTVFLSIIAAAKLLALAFAPIAIVIGSLVTAFAALKAVVTGIVGVFALIGFKGLLITAGIVAAAVAAGLLLEGVRRIASEFFGVNLKALTLVKIVGAILVGAVQIAANTFAKFFNTLKLGFDLITKSTVHLGQIAFDNLQNVAIEALAFIVGAYAEVFKQIPANIRPAFLNTIIEYADGLKGLGFQQKKLSDDAAAARKKELFDLGKKYDQEQRIIDGQTKDATAKMDLDIGQALKDNDKTPELIELAENAGEIIKSRVKTALDGLFEEIKPQEFDFNVAPAVAETRTLTDMFKELPGVIAPSRDSVREQVTAERELNEELVKVTASYREGVELLGLQGRVLQQRQEQFKVEAELREKTKKLLIDEKSAQEILKGIQSQKEESQQRFLKLSTDQQALVEKGVLAGEADVRARTEIGRITAELAVQRETLRQAEQKGNVEQIAAAKAQIDATQGLRDAAVMRLEVQEEVNNQLLDKEPAAVQKEITTIIRDRITISGSEKAQLQQITEVQKDRLDLERLIQQQSTVRLSLLAKQEAFEIQSSTNLTRIETQNAARVFAARNDTGQNQKLVAAENDVRITNEQIRQARVLRDINLQNAQIIQAQSRARVAQLTAEKIKEGDLLRQGQLESAIQAELVLQTNQEALIGAIRDANAAKTEQENEKLTEVNENLAQVRRQIDSPLSTGILDGLRQAATEIPSIYEGIVNTIKSTVSGLTDFISTSIVDAFDPTKEVDLQERFARFLQDIAKQVLQLFTQLAISKAILGLGGILGGGGGLGSIFGGLGGGGGLGFAKGGLVPHQSPRVRGYADGGMIRPAHISPKDTIPAWLSPGEHVMPTKSVREYGADLFERIRRGMVDPSSLRIAAGLSGGRSRMVRAASGPGFASGGMVGRQRVANSGKKDKGQAINTGPVPSYIVASDQAVERLLAGGKNAMLKFIQDNRARIGASLRG